VTAICLLHLRGHRQRSFCETTKVTFRPLDEVKIRRYLARVNPLDKAGAYAIQEEGDLIVEKISGSYTNVVGLPVERLKTELQGYWNQRKSLIIILRYLASMEFKIPNWKDDGHAAGLVAGALENDSV
jgi:hypothetical protein